MTRFIARFWFSTAALAAVLTLGLSLWWQPRLGTEAPRPPLPFSRENYLSAYNGFADHFLFRFGIFGFRERIRSSDVLLVGTSHTIFGLSSSLLAERLSAAAGRPVRVFNLGLAFADHAFTAHLLQRYGFQGQRVVIDLFSEWNDGLSDWGRETERSELPEAYARVGNIWADFFRDWSLDPIFPRLVLTPKGFQARRLLNGFVLRRWEDGDVAAMWDPLHGTTYGRGLPPFPGQFFPLATSQFHPFADLPHRGVQLPPAWQAAVRSNALRPLLVLIPFPTVDPVDAAAVAQAAGYPLIVISPADLATLDDHHLTAASRDIATERLAAEMIRQGWTR